MPIQDREDAAEVEAGIARVFRAPPEERTTAIRRLFVEALDFNAALGELSLAGAPTGVELPDAADRVAELEGVHVLHVALDAPANGRVWRADVSAAARLIADQIGDDLLLVFTNARATPWGANIPSAGQAALRRPVGPSRARSSEASIARLGRTKRSEDPADMTKSARTKGIAVFV